MTRRPDRREFLRRATTSLAGLAGLAAIPRFAVARDPRVARGYPVNEKLRIGIVGVANRGADNLNGVAHQEIAALCDVDAGYLAAAAQRFPQARQFKDFRRMLDAGGLDAVVVSTPDHLHAPASAAAIRAGLHVYCEKPLTHTVHEARVLRRLAREKRVATQMGTQIHSVGNYRRVVERVQGGAIGDVTEVHVWVGGGYSGGERPADAPPVPPTLDWDLWLGPAPQRPYHPAYVPFQWRGWWDFGNGTLGDMACHHMDLPFWALGIESVIAVESDGPPLHGESCPPWLVVKYSMKTRSGAAGAGGAALPLTWYHGDRRPRHFAEGLLPEWGNGTLFVGTKGLLIADYDRHVLLPEKEFRESVPPPPSIPDSIGHYEEWIQAAKGGAPALCHFDYAGPLTEAVLLGVVACKAGRRLTWDAEKGSTGDAAADAFLQREYRKGWAL